MRRTLTATPGTPCGLTVPHGAVGRPDTGVPGHDHPGPAHVVQRRHEQACAAILHLPIGTHDLPWTRVDPVDSPWRHPGAWSGPCTLEPILRPVTPGRSHRSRWSFSAH